MWGGEGGARGGRGKSYMRGGPSSSWNAVLTDLSTHVDIGMGFPHSSVGKESACNTGDLGSIPGLERSPGEGNFNPHQYYCLENPMDRGAWQAIVHGVARVKT